MRNYNGTFFLLSSDQITIFRSQMASLLKFRATTVLRGLCTPTPLRTITTSRSKLSIHTVPRRSFHISRPLNTAQELSDLIKASTLLEGEINGENVEEGEPEEMKEIGDLTEKGDYPINLPYMPSYPSPIEHASGELKSAAVRR
jgi:hypothetical protein